MAVAAPVSIHVDPLGDDGPVERYCYQHLKELQEQRSFFSRRVGIGRIEFSDYISKDLLGITQVLLKIEMEKAVSNADTSGQLYCFQILSKLESRSLNLDG